MKKRVVVAMSGGVDSSVAAALLKKRGYEVIGITMCFNLPDVVSRKPRCCGTQGIEDARRVAHKLGIKHYVTNMRKSLEEKVIKDFCREYASGRTPNPCVRCNQFLKFDILLKKALALDAQYLATGHYARVIRTPNTDPSTSSGSSRAKSRDEHRTPNYLLKKAKDKKKDQSYFLYRLNQRQLKHVLFPLGNYTKEQVRQLARDFALPVADKLASQEICFLPDDDYRAFLKHRLHGLSRTKIKYIAGSRFAGKNTDYTDLKPGPIIDKQGNILGQHKGIAFYTIGQRQGLGVAMGYPVYISGIDPAKNLITLGSREEVFSRRFLIKNPHFIVKPFKKRVVMSVRIRYNHREALAELIPGLRKIEVEFKKPQFAVTPGQSAVFYDRDTVFGGGIIERIID